MGASWPFFFCFVAGHSVLTSVDMIILYLYCISPASDRHVLFRKFYCLFVCTGILMKWMFVCVEEKE